MCKSVAACWKYFLYSIKEGRGRDFFANLANTREDNLYSGLIPDTLKDGSEQVGGIEEGEADKKQVERVSHLLPRYDHGSDRVADDAQCGERGLQELKKREKPREAKLPNGKNFSASAYTTLSTRAG